MTANLLVARATYVEATRCYPAVVITLRRGIWIIEEHELG